MSALDITCPSAAIIGDTISITITWSGGDTGGYHWTVTLDDNSAGGSFDSNNFDMGDDTSGYATTVTVNYTCPGSPTTVNFTFSDTASNIYTTPSVSVVTGADLVEAYHDANDHSTVLFVFNFTSCDTGGNGLSNFSVDGRSDGNTSFSSGATLFVQYGAPIAETAAYDVYDGDLLLRFGNSCNGYMNGEFTGTLKPLVHITEIQQIDATNLKVIFDQTITETTNASGDITTTLTSGISWLNGWNTNFLTVNVGDNFATINVDTASSVGDGWTFTAVDGGRYFGSSVAVIDATSGTITAAPSTTPLTAGFFTIV